jgi:hypothetical protein
LPFPFPPNFRSTIAWNSEFSIELSACMITNSISTSTALLHHGFLSRYLLSYLGIISFHFPFGCRENSTRFFPSKFTQIVKSV